MDKLLAMKAFVEMAQRGSFKDAAHTLGKSGPALVRMLARLEDELGVLLLCRSTRSMLLTSEGEAYLLRCREILAAIRDAEEELASGYNELRGMIRVTAPCTFGQLHVNPLVLEFARQHPNIQFDLQLSDRIVNVVAEDIDVAVRIGPLGDSSLVSRRIGTLRRVVVASPELLGRVGVPTRSKELEGLPCVQHSGLSNSDAWQFRQSSAENSGVFRANQAHVAVQACVAGLGFGRFVYYQAASAIQAGTLRVVLESEECAPIPISLVYAKRRPTPVRLTAFRDWLVARLMANVESICGHGSGESLHAGSRPCFCSGADKAMFAQS